MKMLLGLMVRSHGLLLRLADPEISENGVADGASLLGELAPLGGVDSIHVAFQVAVGDGDLFSRPVGSRAPPGPGRIDTVVAVKRSFDGEDVMAPHGPPGRRERWLSQPFDLVGGWLVGEGAYPLRAGVVEGGVELGEGRFELLSSGAAFVDGLLALLLVGGDRGQMVPQVAFGGGGFIEPAFGHGQPTSGNDDGVVVAPSPPPPGGLVQTFLAVND